MEMILLKSYRVEVENLSLSTLKTYFKVIRRFLNDMERDPRRRAVTYLDATSFIRHLKDDNPLLKGQS